MNTLILPLEFTELFTDFIICDFEEAHAGRSGYMPVGLNHKRGYTHFLIKPSIKLLTTINEYSVYPFIEEDATCYKSIIEAFKENHYLDFIQRDDLTILIRFNYQSIIGSYWINIFDCESVPAGLH